MLDELRAIMDNLYYQYGLIDVVVRLSQVEGDKVQIRDRVRIKSMPVMNKNVIVAES